MLRCGDAQRIRDAFRFGITRGGRCRAPDAAGVGSWRLLDYCSFFKKKKIRRGRVWCPRGHERGARLAWRVCRPSGWGHRTGAPGHGHGGSNGRSSSSSRDPSVAPHTFRHGSGAHLRRCCCFPSARGRGGNNRSRYFWCSCPFFFFLRWHPVPKRSVPIANPGRKVFTLRRRWRVQFCLPSCLGSL